MPEPTRQKITLAEMRASGVRGLLIYCSDYHCSHWTAISGDRRPDDVRLSDLEPRFSCQACGRRVADVRSDFDWGDSCLSVASEFLVVVKMNPSLFIHSVAEVFLLENPIGALTSLGRTR